MKLISSRTPRFPVARVLLLFLLPASGCASWFFRGDGTFVDHGSSSARKRYVLDLGLIDLSAPGSRSFTFRGLPEEVFHVGLWVRDPSSTTGMFDDWTHPLRSREQNSESPLDCEIRLVLRDASNNVELSEEGNLNDWMSGTGGRIPKEAFVHGRFSWFYPRRSETYTLELTVIRPATLSETCKVNLRMSGGGWK
ncbi:MAG TPA: hypothetical protein VMT52_20285 [Planctomycetota bacterium]|nr:hypothetical protein [Planctomycetota bacterium]